MNVHVYMKMSLGNNQQTAGHQSASTLLNHPVKDADGQHDTALYY